MSDHDLGALASEMADTLPHLQDDGVSNPECVSYVRARLGEAVAAAEKQWGENALANLRIMTQRLEDKAEAAEARAERAEAELKARQDRIDEIKRTWGHVEGKEGCQCPICRRDLDAYMEWAHDMEYELYCEGGWKSRAERAEAMAGKMREALAKLYAVCVEDYGTEEGMEYVRAALADSGAS